MFSAGHNTPGDFKELYLGLRQTEGRLYTDEEVARLPGISQDHPYYKEWQLRKISCRQLCQYLAHKNKSIDILEVGCGNGWLSSQLAKITAGTVTGVDINIPELDQAGRVFQHIHNLQFQYGDIRKGILENRKYDTIVFAASIQYFPSFREIISCALQHLQPHGEIHILDSCFYKPSGMAAAKQRSATHFYSIGFPAMRDHYFHHCITDLSYFNHKILYNPDSLIHRIVKTSFPGGWQRVKSPFYRVCIYHHA